MTAQSGSPDPFLAEIVAQPDAIRAAAAALAEQLPALESVERTAARARTIVFTGMGASYNACYPAVNDLARRGIPALMLNTAELLHFRMPILTSEAIVVIVSQSGESAEIVKLAERISETEHRPFSISVTNGLKNRLAGLTDIKLDMAAGAESGPSSKTFVASITQLACLARLIGGEPATQAVEVVRDAADEAAEIAEALLENPVGRAQHLGQLLGGRDVVVILGRGPARAAAEMGALTLKESGVMAESMESAAFRHGPLELAGPDMSAVILATEVETRTLDLGLARELVEAGAAVLVVTPDGDAPKGAEAVAIGSIDRSLAAAVSIVPIQLLAWKLASDAGRVPGIYTRASKVTTRE